MTLESAERNVLAVETELVQERASALGRAGRKLDEEFARCRALAHTLDSNPEPAEVAELLRQYREARQAFEECHWKVCVQREAIGLSDHR